MKMLLPRFMNRGLIEAVEIGRMEGFPFLLPRFMNRGLIEAVGSAFTQSSANRALPRFMNRGLIEARFGRGCSGSRPQLLPRFMNRGLIEARSPTPRREGNSPTSPIHESGPH